MKIKKETTFTCSVCHLNLALQTSGGTGYAISSEGKKVCYKCVGERDANELKNAKPGDRFTHYISNGRVINWPGTLDIPVMFSRKSFHNMAGKNGRMDVWFNYEGKHFWGVNVGDNDLLRIKAIK